MSPTGAKLAILKNFGCQVEDVDVSTTENLDWEFHPTRVSFGGPGGYMVAAAVMNCVILGSLLLLQIGVSWGLLQCGKANTWERALGICRAPGLVFVPYLFLLQGTSLVSSQLVFFPADTNAGFAIVGGIVCALCMGSPAYLWFQVLRHVNDRAEAIPDPQLFDNDKDGVALLDDTDRNVGNEGVEKQKLLSGWKRKLYKLAFGKTVWVSRDGTYWCEKYGIVFETLRPGRTWWIMMEVLVILALGVFSAWRPTNDETCDARNFSIAFFLLSHLIGLLYFWPYSSVADMTISISLSAMMFFAVLFMAIAISTGAAMTSWLFAVSFKLLLASAIILTVKCTWDLATYIIDIILARKSGARVSNNQRVQRQLDDLYELEVEEVGDQVSHSSTHLSAAPSELYMLPETHSHGSVPSSPAQAGEKVLSSAKHVTVSAPANGDALAASYGGPQSSVPNRRAHGSSTNTLPTYRRLQSLSLGTTSSIAASGSASVLRPSRRGSRGSPNLALDVVRSEGAWEEQSASGSGSGVKNPDPKLLTYV